jgi:hypothetical protein
VDVLQLDVSGRPQAWITPREAALLYAADGVAWTLGRAFHVLRGGIQRATGLQSRIELHPIIAVRGVIPSRAWRTMPAMTNPKLFVRDRQVCAYCGGRFGFDTLTREHIVPTSRGGRDTWMNCITACRSYRSNRLPVHGRRRRPRASHTISSGNRTRNIYQFALPLRTRVQ